MKNARSFCLSAPAGRPRDVVLTPAAEARFKELYLLANKDKRSGSASMAWRMVSQEFPELGWDPYERSSKHILPESVRELARRMRLPVAYHRQGERGLRNAGPSQFGGLRMTEDGSRRILAGEKVSFDDGTINFPVVVPWEQGGCKLSEKFGVKLGRFQLLQPLCEGTLFAPSFEYVIRESQGYRAADAAGAALRFARDILKPDAFVFEGGVWQGPRMMRVLDGLGVGLVDVKGRPNQKQVESFFNRLWTRLALEKGMYSVGRFRGEEYEKSEFYVKCRAGKADPRGRFPWLADVLAAMENALRWLNADRVEGRSRWVPEERWAADLAEYPRQAAGGGVPLWLAAPVCEERVVRQRGEVHVRATGPLGVAMEYAFTGPCLMEWIGRRVDVYFDPLGEWPIEAVVAKPGTAVAIGVAECLNPYYEGGIGADAAKRVKEMVRREYRALWMDGAALKVSARETEARGLAAVDVMTFDRSGSDQAAVREKNHGGSCAAEVPDPQQIIVAAESFSNSSLKRRAEAAREAVRKAAGNW